MSADELLDLMVDEGAITPEKAQKIKEKARKIDQVKKAEEDAKRAQELQQVKQEAKTEAKAEAKVEAAKEAQAVVAKNNTDLGLERDFQGLERPEYQRPGLHRLFGGGFAHLYGAPHATGSGRSGVTSMATSV